MSNIIEVSDIKKAYGEVQAIDGVSFYVEKGQLFAFLGPNGAGKSTTIDTLCTLTKLDSGKVIINGKELGKDDDSIRNSIGVVFQEGVLDPTLTIERNLKIRGSFYGLNGQKLIDAVDRVTKVTSIKEILNRKYGKLSGGQKRRCDIARALLNTPKILFLDEPTTGLDPQTRKSVWDTILKLKNEADMTIFLTTHYMEEVLNAEYVVVIDHGKVVAKGTPDDLRNTYASDRIRMFCTDTDQVTELLKKQNKTFTVKGDQLSVNLPTTMAAKPIIDLCENYISGFEVIKGSMDEVFINITGRELRE